MSVGDKVAEHCWSTWESGFPRLFPRANFGAGLVATLGMCWLLATAVAADPRKDYMLHCQGCHGPEGRGVPGAVPSFRGQLSQFLRVEGGRQYLIRVPGVSQSELDDARVAAVLNWIVEEFDGGNRPPQAPPFTAGEVGRWRRPPLAHVDEVRGALLQTLATP